MEHPPEHTVLGVPVSAFGSLKGASEHIVEMIKGRERAFCVAINPEKICYARSDPAFLEVVRHANIRICDGAGVAAAVRILWGRRIPRITGVDLLLQMVARAEEEGLGVFLLGATPEVSRGAHEVLRERHPRLRIVGRRDGYFRDHESEGIVAEINASQADILFVALGSPKQERWIAKHRAQLETPFCMGVGGSFDVLSGRVNRAPLVCRQTGTEWLYRLITDPRRWRRQKALPAFAWNVMRQKLQRKRQATVPG
jgi:N-acetylglucosaminyldiphosphoundecaprenol N-acetyl-beta-D-mannosaminyltransferase